jgi:hypothetical protein
MSFRQRAAPIMLAGLVGVGSGMYIFDPLMRQYAIDSRGTGDPEIAKAGAAGGLGGGVNDAEKAAIIAKSVNGGVTDKEKAAIISKSTNEKNP